MSAAPDVLPVTPSPTNELLTMLEPSGIANPDDDPAPAGVTTCPPPLASRRFQTQVMRASSKLESRLSA